MKPHTSMTYSTHTQVNSQSQIRWQIRRLMLLGGCGVGVPHPSPSGRAPKHSRNLTHASLRLRSKRRSLFYTTKTPPPIEVPAFSFTPSLFFYPSLSAFLAAALLLPSAASQPIKREVTSSCCSQCGGSSMNIYVCVSVGWKVKQYTCKRHLKNNNRVSLCHCQTS